MTWRKLSDDVAVTDYATSSYAPLQVVENEAALRADHGRSCGSSYGVTDPLEVRPPTTSGGLGPIVAPFIAPRPQFTQRLEVRLRVRAPDDGPVSVRAWALADGTLVSGAAVIVPDDAEADLVASVVVPGRAAAGSDWIVGGWGLTVDDLDPVQVTQEGTTTIQVVDWSDRGVMSGTGLLTPAGVEYTLPTGQTVYIGATGSFGALFWPLPAQGLPGSIVNQDTDGYLLPRVQVVSWSVTFRSASVRNLAQVSDGALLQSTGPAAVRDRTTEAWEDGSQWWCAAPERTPPYHGIPEHASGDVARVPMPHHFLLSAVRGAVLARTWGGRRSVDLRTRVEELDTDGSVLSTEADATVTASTSEAGVGVQYMTAQARTFGVLAQWEARDLVLSDEVGGFDLLRAAVDVGAPDTDDWWVRLGVDTGDTVGAHVASVSLVEVVRLDDGTEVVVLGIATVWDSADFASRPTVGLRVGDLLTTLDTGFVWEWDGSDWLLRQATVAAWANRPLPASVPSGAGLDAGSRVTVTTVGRRSNVAFRWVPAITAWDLVEPGLVLEDVFASTTAGSRLFSWDAYLRGNLVGAPTNITSLRDTSANAIHAATNTGRYEDVDGWPAQVTRRNQSEANSTGNTNVASNVGVMTYMGVGQRILAPDASGNSFATFQNTSTGFYMDFISLATTGILEGRARRNTADGIVSVSSGVNPGQDTWVAGLVRANFVTGALTFALDGQEFTGTIPGTPANTASASAQVIAMGNTAGSPAGQFNNWRRRGMWLKEGTFSNDDVALAMAILRSIRDL